MKTFAFLVASALAGQAALLEFDLSPTGTDTAVGLSPSNAVPAVTNSMGSGGELGEGIYLDTATEILMLNVGYGSAPGFTDLTGPATMAHIHRPAMSGEVATNIIDLAPIHFVQITNAGTGGIIQGAVMVSLVGSNAVQELLDGLWYINIHTATNPAGEIRGQLILANTGPEIICPADSVSECGEAATNEVFVMDADGDDVTVMWTVNGQAQDPVLIPGTNALTGTNLVIVAEYPPGTNTLEFTAIDTLQQMSSCLTRVVVEDTTPPVITSVSADPDVLWPPNHTRVAVNVSAEVEETCGSATWGISHVTSNEPINGPGDGNTDPDWWLVDDNTVELRAERSGTGSGRVYTIWLGAMDDSGNLSEPATVEVVVPHDQGGDDEDSSPSTNRRGRSFWRR